MDCVSLIHLQFARV